MPDETLHLLVRQLDELGRRRPIARLGCKCGARHTIVVIAEGWHHRSVDGLDPPMPGGLRELFGVTSRPC